MVAFIDSELSKQRADINPNWPSCFTHCDSFTKWSMWSSMRLFHKYEVIECLFCCWLVHVPFLALMVPLVIHAHGINELACIYYANQLMVIWSSSLNPTSVLKITYVRMQEYKNSIFQTDDLNHCQSPSWRSAAPHTGLTQGKARGDSDMVFLTLVFLFSHVIFYWDCSDTQFAVSTFWKITNMPK